MKNKYVPELCPLPHQRSGVIALIRGGILNADEQGLGKTKQCYDTIATLIARNEIELGLMIVKASLRDHLLDEIQNDAFQLSAAIVTGSRRERELTYKFLAHHVLVLSYETASSDHGILCDLIRSNKTLIALDESHYIKNPDSKRTQAVLAMAKMAKKAIAFSGTPLPNGVDDLFSQLKFLGHDVGESLLDFRKRYPTAEQLKDVVQNFVVRRRKDEVKGLRIPPKQVRVVEVDLNPSQKEIYRAAVEKLIVEFQRAGSRKRVVPIRGILSKFTRLLQITSNPRTIIPEYDEDPAKFKCLDTLVDGALQDEGKVIIWTNYRRNVEELVARYSHHGAVALFGGVSRAERVHNVTRFQNSIRTKVLIAVPACAREGFTLTAARTAIYVDRNFSALDWLQSQDRIHRVGQTKKCEIIVLKTNGTIEDWVDSLLLRKEEVQRSVLGDTPSKGMDKITSEEAIAILKASRGN